MSLNVKQTKAAAIRCIRAGLTPFVQSSPGMGKSAMFKEIANEFNLYLIDYRISSADPTDFNGYPEIDRTTHTARYVPFDTFPTEKMPLPMHADGVTPYDGWLLLMDELNHGNPSILRSAYKLILDKMVGQQKLHKKLVICAAGNLATDNAMTNKLGSALDSRVIQLFMKTDVKEWLNFANLSNFDYRITAFINYKQDALNTFGPNTEAGAFPCQRTWEFAHKLIKNESVITEEVVQTIAGALSEGMAREFAGFTRVFQDLPDINDIVNNPKTAKLPTKPDTMYAVSGLLANHATMVNAKAILEYASRLPTEFTVISIQDAVRRTPQLANHDALNDWINKNYNDVV